MADSTAEESPAQRAARLRREKREKKIMDGGSDRLARITNASGRKQDLQPSLPPKPTVADDPGDVDIPHVPAALTATAAADGPGVGPTAEDTARLRAALRAQQPQMSQDGGSGAPADPMMQLMQQMLGMPPPGAGGGPAAAGGPAGGPGVGPELPPALASLLTGQPMAPGQQGPAADQAASTGGYLWRIIHALFALSFGLYIVLTLPFSGSKEDRFSQLAAPPRSIFWIFATAELGLQSTRYLLERGKPQQGGMIVTVAGFLPEPYRNYLLLIARYSTIWTTLVEDTMVVVFMLGSVAWWGGDLD